MIDYIVRFIVSIYPYCQQVTFVIVVNKVPNMEPSIS